MSDRIACVGGNRAGIDHFGNIPGIVNYLGVTPGPPDHANFFYPPESLTNFMMWFWGIRKWHIDINVDYSYLHNPGGGDPLVQVPVSASIEFDLFVAISPDNGETFQLPERENDLLYGISAAAAGGVTSGGGLFTDTFGELVIQNFVADSFPDEGGDASVDFQAGLDYNAPLYVSDDHWSCSWGFSIALISSTADTVPTAFKTREFINAISIIDVNGTRNTGLSMFTEPFSSGAPSNITGYSATMTATEYWPHKNKAGQLVYDTSTGVQINSLP